MKAIAKCIIFLLCLSIINLTSHAQIGIGTVNPDPSALLHLESGDKGVLIPRLSKNQRNAINTPATGLKIYQTDSTSGPYFYDGGFWRTMGAADRVVNIIASSTTLNDGHDVIFVNNTNEINISLPTAADNSGKSFYLKKTSDNTVRAIVIPSGSETINSDSLLELFMLNDAVRIISDGSNWQVISDELQPFVAKMSSNAQQTLVASTVTKLDFNTEDFDNGGMADVTTDRFTIRRSGKYKISAQVMISIEVTKYMDIRIYLNGVNNTINLASPGRTINSYPIVSDVLDLQEGDYIEFHVYHNNTANAQTTTSSHTKPRMSVTEIR